MSSGTVPVITKFFGKYKLSASRANAVVNRNCEAVSGSGSFKFRCDKIIAREAGRLKATYNTKLFDAFIAATALTLKLSLLTLNKADFAKIPNLSFYTPTR